MFAAPRAAIPSTPGAPQLPMSALMAIVFVMYLVPAIWGLASSIGLWRLKNWARISTIVFAVLLCMFGVFGGLGALAVPAIMKSQPSQPPNASQITIVVIASMLVFSIGELAVGVWWAIYFTRRSVTAQFIPAGSAYVLSPTSDLSAGPAAIPATLPAGRPISISIIAWFLLVCSIFFPFTFLLHTPQLLFGVLINGPAAMILMTAYLFVVLYVGIGLLKLWPSARLVGIGYFVFGMVNMAATWLRPGAADLFQRMMASQPKMFGPTPDFAFTDTFLKLIMISTAITMAIPIYFLVTRKAAFYRKESFSGPAS
ncbi:hypothetical protein Acid345_0272 [Candidatus Koribacter versatilis Ellin345]|uniref:Uncharacterized protein n=2 Tax=Candidatus Korobacter versatilis TaxID=658062 RepID=Q1IV23_KORVE|nr:hypothetical protein Acid345_0272 [Candidatus Koribacter versatilis Ellin345]